MSTLKSIARSATVAFAPTASIMAVGTMAGGWMSDFANTEEELPVIASSPTAERFNRISWGNNAVGSEEYALGIIAGSLVDGTIMLWNPTKLTSEDGGSPEESVIASWRKHEGTNASPRGEISYLSWNRKVSLHENLVIELTELSTSLDLYPSQGYYQHLLVSRQKIVHRCVLSLNESLRLF
ncbi:hypothetical protein Mapa_014325 [Marchantia paleacea]|nr:hypothetical protein Mapa_014325 [Marchantia paleacea]